MRAPPRLAGRRPARRRRRIALAALGAAVALLVGGLAPRPSSAQDAPPRTESACLADLDRVKAHLAAGKPTDLETRPDGSLAFPVRFRGPYTVTVRGDAYADAPDEAPAVHVGMEEDPRTKRVQTWGLSFGVPPFAEGGGKAWIPPRIVHGNGTEKTVVAEKKDAHPAQPRRPFRVEATMTATRVTGSANGVSIGSVAKPDGVFDYARVFVPGWREIVVSGQIEPSWIQGRLDAIVDGPRRAFDANFDANFDVKTVLPPWRYEAREPAGTTAPRAGGLGTSTSSLPLDLLVPYAEALEPVAQGDPKGALAAAEALRARRAPEAALGVLVGRALLALDEPTKALAEVDKALAADLSAFDAMLVKAGILVRLARDTDLTLTLQPALKRPEAGAEADAEAGADAEAYVAAGRFLLLAGRLDEARRIAEDAARRGERSEALDLLGQIVVRAQSGPAWPRWFKDTSSPYHVVSDIDADTCRKAALVLKDALADFRAHVRSLQPGPRRLYRVDLFSGRATFQAYVGDALSLLGKPPEQAAGRYSPVLKPWLVWNLPDRDEMMRTIRHEGFHQVLDRLLPDPPVWLNEGLAVDFEEGTRVGCELRTDVVRDDQIKHLRARPLMPMAEFARLRPDAFDRASPHSYAQAWLVAHLLRHGTPKHTDLDQGRLGRLETVAGAEAMRALLDDAALDGELQAHLAALAARR